jgi:hypothetical protein
MRRIFAHTDSARWARRNFFSVGRGRFPSLHTVRGTDLVDRVLSFSPSTSVVGFGATGSSGVPTPKWLLLG